MKQNWREFPLVKKSPTKNEALEALDFIINVLKEHEKDLDRLIGELGKITERLGNSGELGNRIEGIEERLANLQDEISNLIEFLTSAPTPTSTHPSERHELPVSTVKPSSQRVLRGPPVIIRCRKWEEFKVLAANAETISFLYKDTEKAFQVDALKNGRILTFAGDLPGSAVLLKSWLSRELGVSEENILEGILAIG